MTWDEYRPEKLNPAKWSVPRDKSKTRTDYQSQIAPSLPVYEQPHPHSLNSLAACTSPPYLSLTFPFPDSAWTLTLLLKKNVVPYEEFPYQNLGLRWNFATVIEWASKCQPSKEWTEMKLRLLSWFCSPPMAIIGRV